MNEISFNIISPRVLYILLALAVKERHGYEIMKQVANESDGKVTMGPATLYGAIKKLLADEWIEEAENKDQREKGQERRKYYRLTAQGRKQLATELQKYEEILKKARENKILTDETRIFDYHYLLV
jgi:DNA-binding PadR family transcriptional regulator